MKKVMNKIILAFTFALAIVVGATPVVSAAEKYSDIKNMNVMGDFTEVKIENQAIGGSDVYYVVNDVNANFVLDYVKNNDGLLPFTSKITVVKCGAEIGGICSKYYQYEVDVDVDALRNNNGFVLPLNGFEDMSLVEEVSSQDGLVRGTQLSDLKSFYGPLNTMYVIIDYVTTEKYFSILKMKTLERQVSAYTEVLKVIDLSEVGGGVSIASKVEGTKSTITVTSSVHQTTIKYFASADLIDFEAEAQQAGKKLSEVFAEKAADAATEQTLVNELLSSTDANRKGIVFTTEFEITLEGETHYYVLAIDETGAEAVLDVSKTAQTNAPQAPTPTPLPEVAGDSQVGKIILIILVGVLVLAATLVIIQKIVDHRRKLY